MKRLKGPELKVPELKVPDIVADLFYDLRDRRLLPLIALVLVAIVAVPFLLGGGSEEAAVPPPVAAAAMAAKSGAEGPHLTVVRSKPGLRDYRKRLAGREPTDPFKQRYNGPVLTGAELKSQSPTSTSSSATIESTSPTTATTE